jgi:DNA-binding FadR family transcriptional regulator
MMPSPAAIDHAEDWFPDRITPLRPHGKGTRLSDSLPGLQSKSAAIVARDMCRRIVEGEYQDGDVLPPEAELIATYGVSRAVLREALRLLEWDSFVAVRRGAGGGAVVMLPDVRVPARYCGLVLQVLGTSLEDVDRAIGALEPELVGAIADDPASAFDILEQALDAETDTERSASEFLRSGSHFHELLPTALGNPALKVLLDIPRQIRVRHDLTALSSLTEDPVYHRKTFSAHRKALKLMKDGDGEGARDLWSRHLAATSQALRKGQETTVLDLFNGRAIDVDLMAGAIGGRRQTRIPKGADIVASDLRRQIVTGAIGEGDPVPTEGALMEHYGLSRPSVREALRVLEAEHLVQLVRGAHQGGRARRPNIGTAIWQTGLLMERLGCTVGQLAEAQLIIERCASRMLTGSKKGHANGPSIFDAVFQVGPTEPTSPGGDLAATLDMFDAIGAHVPNHTLRSLATIGRTLLRHAVETAGLSDDGLTHSASRDSRGSQRGRATTEPVRTQLTLLRAAGSRSFEQLRTAWADGSARIYRAIGESAITNERIDMFR